MTFRLMVILLLTCYVDAFAAGGAFEIYNNKLSFPDGTEFSTAPKDGKTIYNGSGSPVIAATPGDFYIDTLNNRLYGPYIGSWGTSVSLIGPQGTKGDTGAQGLKGDTGASPWMLNGTKTYYSAGNVGIGTVNPNSTLEVAGDMIRTISRVYGIDGTAFPLTTNWQDVVGRTITYTKKASDTALRITYSDQKFFYPINTTQNFAVFEIVVDGVSCPSGALVNYVVLNSGYPVSDQSTQVKTCFNVNSGSHTIKVRVKSNNSTSGSVSAAFGTFNGITLAWMMEVEEVR